MVHLRAAYDPEMVSRQSCWFSTFGWSRDVEGPFVSIYGYNMILESKRYFLG